jgi:hypothetical protein
MIDVPGIDLVDLSLAHEYNFEKWFVTHIGDEVYPKRLDMAQFTVNQGLRCSGQVRLCELRISLSP